MLEFILNLGRIYIVLGLLITFSFSFINYISDDKENEFTFSETLSCIFFYPIILHYVFKK
jgi:hypothetical protein